MYRYRKNGTANCEILPSVNKNFCEAGTMINGDRCNSDKVHMKRVESRSFQRRISDDIAVPHARHRFLVVVRI